MNENFWFFYSREKFKKKKSKAAENEILFQMLYN